MYRKKTILILIILVFSFMAGLILSGQFIVDTIPMSDIQSSESNPDRTENIFQPTKSNLDIKIKKSAEENNQRLNNSFDIKTGIEELKGKALEENDFVLSDGKNNIALDIKYENFKDYKETQSSFLGEFFYGDFAYRFYLHEFEGFSIYSSNARYDVKNRDFNEYYIVNVFVKDSVFKTARGISTGTGRKDVIKAYGEGKELIDKKNRIGLEYRMKEKLFLFQLDEKNQVEEITMKIDM
ncbi:MAG: hypothetical protein N2484_12235 [Clostridia bacterium]|nr:hypothetical protein [Clostridia bacterium]